MMRRLIFGIALAGLGAPTLAHPHSQVDQQLLVSLGRDGAAMQILITPSASNGAEIYGQIDLDRSGEINDAEAQAFAARVASAVRVEIDQTNMAISVTRVDLPDLDSMVAATRPITLETSVTFEALAIEPHEIVIEMSYQDLSHDWFIQPYLRPDLIALDAAPRIERREDGRWMKIQVEGGR